MLHRIPSNRDIGRSLNISSGTVSNYLYRARVAGLTLAEALSLGEQQLYERLFLPSKASSTRRVLPDWECIHAELRKKGMTLMLLWREYRECHPDGVGYSLRGVMEQPTHLRLIISLNFSINVIYIYKTNDIYTR